MHQAVVAGLLFILLGITAGGADAAIISYSASGTLSDSGGLGPAPFPNGTAISVQFSIDAATPDSNLSDTSVGHYDGVTGTFTLGGETYSIESYGYRYVEVANDYSYYFGPGDLIRIFISTSNFASLDTPVYNGARIHNLTLLLRSTSNSTTIFASDALSNSIGVNLGQFPGSGFGMQLGNLVYYNSDTGGPVTALSSTSTVPLPAAAWLFGGALGLLGVARRGSTTGSK